MTAMSVRMGVDEAELLRGQVYTLLGRLLMRPPDAALLDALAALERDHSDFGHAIGAVGEAAGATTARDAEREYNALFIGVTRGEVVPYGSFYRTGFLNDWPLARLREDMAAFGLARAEAVSEPEDHLGALCDMMAVIATRPEPVDRQAAFFERHLRRWAGRAFADIEQAPSAVLYRRVGTLGRLFMDIEEQAFALANPGGHEP